MGKNTFPRFWSPLEKFWKNLLVASFVKMLPTPINFTQLSLKWTWTINNNIGGSVVSLCWLNRTHFLNHLFECFSTLRLSEMIFFSWIAYNAHFCERFLQISNILSRDGSRGGRLGRSPTLKLTKVNLFYFGRLTDLMSLFKIVIQFKAPYYKITIVTSQRRSLGISVA